MSSGMLTEMNAASNIGELSLTSSTITVTIVWSDSGNMVLSLTYTQGI